jgi:hypothetical protein
MEKEGGIIALLFALIAMMNSVKNKAKSYVYFFAAWRWELLRFWCSGLSIMDANALGQKKNPIEVRRGQMVKLLWSKYQKWNVIHGNVYSISAAPKKRSREWRGLFI